MRIRIWCWRFKRVKGETATIVINRCKTSLSFLFGLEILLIFFIFWLCSWIPFLRKIFSCARMILQLIRNISLGWIIFFRNSLILWISVLWRSILFSGACLVYYCLPDTCTLQIDYSRELHTAYSGWESFHVLWKKIYIYIYIYTRCVRKVSDLRWYLRARAPDLPLRGVSVTSSRSRTPRMP